jgi:chorismate-pyruvate lyase
MNRELNLLFPLDTFYAQSGTPLPQVSQVAGEKVPQPYRQILVHGNDMTPTLETFHGDRIHLRVLDRHLEGDAYSRLVVLTLNGSDKPVEFGAIVINLEHFPAEAREAVVEGWSPLGTILADYKVEHTSRPQAFIKVRSDGVMSEALGLAAPADLYGRRNHLITCDGAILADILEVLPPV